MPKNDSDRSGRYAFTDRPLYGVLSGRRGEQSQGNDYRKYGGIGAAIRYYEAKDRIAVVEPTEGMPAAEAGVKAGDIILSVGGKEMVRGDMKPQEFSSKVSEALRGEPGTSFVLKVLRPLKNDSTVMEFKITRKNIRTNPVPYYGMVKDSIGYLALSSFTENSAKDFKKLLSN